MLRENCSYLPGAEAGCAKVRKIVSPVSQNKRKPHFNGNSKNLSFFLFCFCLKFQNQIEAWSFKQGAQNVILTVGLRESMLTPVLTKSSPFLWAISELVLRKSRLIYARQKANGVVKKKNWGSLHASISLALQSM